MGDSMFTKAMLSGVRFVLDEKLVCESEVEHFIYEFTVDVNE